MAGSTGKTIGLILLVIVLALFLFGPVPFMFAPLGVFPTLGRVMSFPRGGHFGFMDFTALSVVSLTLLIIWILVIVWVYRDAERRRMNGVLWALLVFIGNLVGLLIYLIVRSDNPPESAAKRTSQTCPQCDLPLSPQYVFCPHCGTRLQPVCTGCGKPVEKNWKVCPHCGTTLQA